MIEVQSEVDGMPPFSDAGVKTLVDEISRKIAQLREFIIEPVDIPISDGLSIELTPSAGHDDRIHVYRKDWGGTCVNYTSEGLILDVFNEGDLNPVHTASLHASDLQDGEIVEIEGASARL